MASYYFDEQGQKRLVDPAYGSLPPPGAQVFSDMAGPQAPPGPIPARQPLALGTPKLSFGMPEPMGGMGQAGAAPPYDYSDAPPQRIAGGIDPSSRAISPSLTGSSMFRTAEQEMDYNDAVSRGDTGRIREIIQDADVYSKETARRSKIDNMLNMAVMTGLGVAAGAPGSYGDFGTQVARGALTGINYANAQQDQDAMQEYRKGELETARQRALSYQQQVATARRNSDMKGTSEAYFKGKNPADGQMYYWRRNPTRGGPPELVRDSNGQLIRANENTDVLWTDEGAVIVDKGTGQGSYAKGPSGGRLNPSPHFTVFNSTDPQTGVATPVVVNPNTGVAKTIISSAGPVVSGTPDKMPVPPAVGIERLDGLALSMTSAGGAPEPLLAELRQLRQEFLAHPNLFNQKIFDDRIGDIRKRYDDYAKSSAGIAAGVLGQSNLPAPSSTPVPAATPGSLPPPANLGGGLAPQPSPLPVFQPPSPAQTPSPMQTPAGRPNQLEIDSLIEPLASANKPATEAVRLLMSSLGMSEEQARTAVREYSARNP